MARAIIPNDSCMTYVAPGHQYHYPLWFIIHSYRGPGPLMQPSTVGQQMWWLWPQAINNTTHCGSLYIVTVASIKWQQTPLSMARVIIPNVSGITYVAPGHQYHYPLWFVIHSYRGPGPSMQPRTVGQQMWWLWPQAIYTTTHCGSLYIVTVAQGHQCNHAL